MVWFCDSLDRHSDWVCIGLQSGTIVSELNAKDFIYRCLAEKEKSLFIYIEIDRLVIKYWKSYRAVLLVSQIASSCGYGSGVTRQSGNLRVKNLRSNGHEVARDRRSLSTPAVTRSSIRKAIWVLRWGNFKKANPTTAEAIWFEMRIPQRNVSYLCRFFTVTLLVNNATNGNLSIVSKTLKRCLAPWPMPTALHVFPLSCILREEILTTPLESP